MSLRSDSSRSFPSMPHDSCAAVETSVAYYNPFFSSCVSSSRRNSSMQASSGVSTLISFQESWWLLPGLWKQP
ncbi:hypothetical protein FOIG_16937 [Fusarium odoratissimum NRRL 54006]|uniref:Uncharacterized protein n=1 Tax=Fusarium odoratissimum (strain NRRL 54006) TaxID=1089451 RepID=X0JY55_FUSO5|nr:uncharacterized protein FOIG_16937 [Fusarium odoratissimum NRRL 54006]EXL89779.1 hypothetical protein FOIG_16937 [Fusarium odoratissimum NRRL 54006]